MGIPGLLKEIGKGERVALAKLAVEHLQRTQRPLRIAIDAAIWDFQHQAGQGGKNPELRTLFFRLLKLLALPVHPVFVYDGKEKPLTKRGKTVSRYNTCIPNELSKNLVARFQFPHHTAPGEAEAECAILQRNGIVDAVMSQDVDAIMFGSNLTLRDWSKEGTKGNKTPTHVNVLSTQKIKEFSGLDTQGMILVAMLSGGDYHDGVPGFGPTLACAIARAGFGAEMIELVNKGDELGLREWRERLQYELTTNESGYFARKSKTLVVPEDFPNKQILGYYTHPATSSVAKLSQLEERWRQWWDKEIDIKSLRDYTGMTFDWLYKAGARRFIRCLAQPLFQNRLRRNQVAQHEYSSDSITERRQHFITDGIPELRFSAVSLNVVGIDLEAEEENPEFADLEGNESGSDIETTKPTHSLQVKTSQEHSTPSRRREGGPWDPEAYEKWWIPEILLQLGLPAVVENWHQQQREILADPVKFATRKCPKPKAKAKVIDISMKQGAINDFFGTTRLARNAQSTLAKSKPRCPDTVKQKIPSSPDSPRIRDYFRATKITTAKTSDRSDALRSCVTETETILLESTPPSSPVTPTTRTPTKMEPETSGLPASVSTRRRRSARSTRNAGIEKSVSGVEGSAGGSVHVPAARSRMAHAGTKQKKSVQSRESLPGTWKEDAALVSNDRRITLVDLREN